MTPFVVGLGASAGGLEPVADLLSAADPKAPIAWVLAQHLAPDHRSFFADILQRRTRLEVRQARHLEPVEAGTVYVIEPGTRLRVNEGRITVEPWRRDQSSPSSTVDTLFASLANLGSHCAVVVLSGGGSDGADGARKVAEAGGLVLVQDPDTASFESMPRATMRKGVAKAVLAPSEIPAYLHRHMTELEDPEPELTIPDQILRIAARAGHVDLDNYKVDGMERRMARRMQAINIEHEGEYLARLESDPTEARALLSELLIGVTSFFRDPEAWDALRAAFKARVDEEDKPVFRIWVVGCSTGEEAYTAAMVLDDVLADAGRGQRFKLFATDVDGLAVEQASRGTYTATQVQAVPKHLVGRYFSRDEEGNYRIRTFLRESMLFSQHDAVREPPFSRLDVLTCRNLMIYLRPESQQRLLHRFAFSLASGGLLLLGPGESTSGDAWQVVDRRWRVFEATGAPSRSGVPAGLILQHHRIPDLRESHDRLGDLHRAITEGFTPPHAVTREDLSLVYRSGKLGGLLRLPSGPVSTDLRRMVPESVAVVLTMARDRLRELASESDPGELLQVRFPDVTTEVGEDGRAVQFDLVARRVRSSSRQGLMLIFLFCGLADAAPRSETQSEPISEEVWKRMQELESELASSELRLQSTVEQLESSNEELQATNEELLASNEELQSVNEELHTVNQEYEDKIGQLTLVTSELEEVLHSVDAGVLRVDENLIIRRLNERMVDMTRFRHEDRGRPVSDVTPGLGGVSVVDLLQRVIDTGQTASATGRSGSSVFLVHARPLVINLSQRGATLTCTDVTAMEQFAALEARLATAMNTASTPIAVEDEAGIILFANHVFASVLHRDARWLKGSAIDDLLGDRSAALRARRALATTDSWSGSLPIRFGADVVVPVPMAASGSWAAEHMRGVVWQVDVPSAAERVAPDGLGFIGVSADQSIALCPTAAGLLGTDALARMQPLGEFLGLLGKPTRQDLEVLIDGFQDSAETMRANFRLSLEDRRLGLQLRRYHSAQDILGILWSASE